MILYFHTPLSKIDKTVNNRKNEVPSKKVFIRLCWRTFCTASMMERGDKYHLAVCNKSGMTAIYNPSRKIFLSPMMDGPMKFTGLSSVEDIKIENVSQHGRDFSVISVP
jgi:hypothetical protein